MTNNPGALPQNVTGAAVVIGKQIRQHKEELHIFRQVENSDLTLKSQLIDVFDETYFRGLRNRHTGFSGVSYFRMISNLYVNYGTITAVDLIENERRMDTPFDQSGAIETYIDQTEDAVEFTEAGASPFTMVQITTKAFIQMFTTGLFKDECKARNRLPTVARYWATFKLIFTAAARELQEMQAMSGTAGYANSVTADLMTQKSEAFTNLAQASAQDRIAVTNVATNNTTILEQLAKALAALATIQTQVSLLEGRLGGANSSGNSGNNNGGNVGANGANRNPRRNNRNQDNKSYCHTHGCTHRDDHTSATCNHPADGHVTTATIGDKKGSSTCYC